MAVYQSTRTITVTPTVTAGAYAAGDVVGGLLTFDAGIDRGTIQSVVIVDNSGQAPAMNLYFFNDTPTTIADNAAISGLTDADNLLFIGKVATGTFDTNVNASYTGGVNLAYSLDGNLLSAYLVTNASTPTLTATDDITIRVTIRAD